MRIRTLLCSDIRHEHHSMKSTVINIMEIERNIVVGQRVVCGYLIIYNSAELSIGGASGNSGIISILLWSEVTEKVLWMRWIEMSVRREVDEFEILKIRNAATLVACRREKPQEGWLELWGNDVGSSIMDGWIGSSTIQHQQHSSMIHRTWMDG